jgi:hypothetical protein
MHFGFRGFPRPPVGLSKQNPIHGILLFTASGEFVVPDGVYSLWVSGCGPGGNGGNGGTTSGASTSGSGGGGGGAGDVAIRRLIPVIPRQAIPVVVGLTSGNSTSFGSFFTLASGTDGGNGTSGGLNQLGGGGGTTGGQAGCPTFAVAVGSNGGKGADSPFGVGGAPGNARITAGSGNPGAAASGYGAGGGGGGGQQTNGGGAGGAAGSPGLIVVEW